MVAGFWARALAAAAAVGLAPGLAGCPGQRAGGDECLRQTALEGFRTDYVAGLDALRAIEDPLIKQATVMDVVRASDVVLRMPDQVEAVCGEASSETLRSLCMERYSYQHIKRALDEPSAP